MTGESFLSNLAAPFDTDRVSWRVGSTTSDKTKGMMLAYIDSRDVQDRLDKVCGVNWACRYMQHGTTTICEIGVKVGDDWIWRADGAGATDVEAEKGQLSDSFKRAAVKWGIGRYLYDVDSPWVEVEAAGRSVKMKASEKPKLLAALRRVGQPSAPKSEPASTNPPPAKTPASDAPKPSGDFVEEDEPISIPTEGKSAGEWGKELIAKFKAAPDMATLMAWKEKNAKVIDQLGPKAKKSVEDAYAVQHEAIVSA